MQHSKTAMVVGSSAESLASGTSSFGKCVTNVGWMSVGSINFGNLLIAAIWFQQVLFASVLKKQFRYTLIALIGRAAQRRKAVVGLCVDIGSFDQQQFYQVQPTKVVTRHFVQRRLAAVVLGIDISFVG